MMAEQVDQEIYIYMGGHDVVPPGVTRVRVHEAVKVIPKKAFKQHPNLVEFECHNGVERIGENAFFGCRSLKRVKIPGVKAIGEMTFYNCESLTDVVECDKLERIGERAFRCCKSLRYIKMPSIEIVAVGAFNGCINLMGVECGDKLERVGVEAFIYCVSLKRITIPLKNGMITHDNVFLGCEKLERVDLVGGTHKTIAALHLEEWRKDMNEEIDRINQILPNTFSGSVFHNGYKTLEIRIWITSLLRKIYAK